MGGVAMKADVRYRDSALRSALDRKLYFVHHIPNSMPQCLRGAS